MFIDKEGKKVNFEMICRLPDINGTNYPDGLSIDQLAILGYQEIPDPIPPEAPEGFSRDEAFIYTESEDAPYCQWALKPPEMLAQITQNKINIKAQAYLASTDWMVTRFAETGKAIDPEIKTARQAARDSIVQPKPVDSPKV